MVATEEKTNDNQLPEGVKIPDEFGRIIEDFTNDIKITFPEYNGIIDRWWKTDPDNKEKKIISIFKHCMKIIPERFFDILYKNNGLERYPDFKLYKMIARCVHKHTPLAQLERPEFQNFIISKKLLKDVSIMNIDEIPSYI